MAAAAATVRTLATCMSTDPARKTVAQAGMPGGRCLFDFHMRGITRRTMGMRDTIWHSTRVRHDLDQGVQ
ncbi:endopolyphosphatase [Mycolicibacterium brisbanense]|uniref:Endopolyphosphatase n=1 Tax=Mycolicibacterium brisbanense TaxID=146020 RepID=A0A100W3Q7_9MYCO|nr:endopolyphosphatase [Mycolicibacterium brisbanense]